MHFQLNKLMLYTMFANSINLSTGEASDAEAVWRNNRHPKRTDTVESLANNH